VLLSQVLLNVLKNAVKFAETGDLAGDLIWPGSPGDTE
jgi:signal transduction histidine kinase